MNRQPFDHMAAALFLGTLWRSVRQRVAGACSPCWRRPFLGPARRVIGVWLLLSAGLVVQVVLVCLTWEVVDLSISLMELWAELARKHLEITLDQTV